MTEKHCKVCTTIKVYDDKYRCMTCYKEFVVADQEEVMQTEVIAPAIARIQELEVENQTLKQKVAALMAAMGKRSSDTDKGWSGAPQPDGPAYRPLKRHS